MSNQTFLDISEIIKSMNNETAITDLVWNRIFDWIPDFTNFSGAINKNYIILEVVSLSNIEECTKSNRMVVRFISWTRKISLKELRGTYNAVREFLVSNTKDFWTFKPWSISESGYIETDDQNWNRMIINDYIVSFLYDN